MIERKRILSGIRPTGKLHLGHWVGVLSNWVQMQDEYECFFMSADWHALMSEYKTAGDLEEIIYDNISDWLAWGIDVSRSVVFVQSDVVEHLELFMFLSFVTPLGWLSRCPTFKEQLKQLKEKEINTYAFFGYPVLQAADILLYKAHCVPVGEDQLPHLEIAREIVRRFHFIYGKEVFFEPQPLLTQAPKFLGLDGRKMSKSYNNFILLDEADESLREKILTMFTDPSRLRKRDKGHPDICNVFSYYSFFAPRLREEVYEWCSTAKKGCRDCKKELAEILAALISEKRKKKQEYLSRKDYIHSVLEEGRKRARVFAAATIQEVKRMVKGGGSSAVSSRQ